LHHVVYASPFVPINRFQSNRVVAPKSGPQISSVLKIYRTFFAIEVMAQRRYLEGRLQINLCSLIASLDTKMGSG